MGAKVLNVLVADDSEDDKYFLRRALKDAAVPLRVTAELEHGGQIIDYLSGLGQYADRARFPIPDVLITDLKMPIMSGWEVLEWLQAHPQPQMEKIGLTGCLLKGDQELCDKFKETVFVQKSANMAHLEQVVTMLTRRASA